MPGIWAQGQPVGSLSERTGRWKPTLVFTKTGVTLRFCPLRRGGWRFEDGF